MATEPRIVDVNTLNDSSSAGALSIPETQEEADALLERAHWLTIARCEALLANQATAPREWIPAAREVLAYARTKPPTNVNMKALVDNQLHVTIEYGKSTNSDQLIDSNRDNVKVIDN